MEELPLDHEPSLDHWARRLADDDIATGYHTNWDYAYEQAWHWLDSRCCSTYYERNGKWMITLKN